MVEFPPGPLLLPPWLTAESSILLHTSTYGSKFLRLYFRSLSCLCILEEVQLVITEFGIFPSLGI